jgi:hypothetical protein
MCKRLKKLTAAIKLLFGDYFAFLDYDVFVFFYPHYFVSSLQFKALHNFLWDRDLTVGCDFAYFDYLV